jgi:hypothetical protein
MGNAVAHLARADHSDSLYFGDHGPFRSMQKGYPSALSFYAEPMDVATIRPFSF